MKRPAEGNEGEETANKKVKIFKANSHSTDRHILGAGREDEDKLKQHLHPIHGREEEMPKKHPNYGREEEMPRQHLNHGREEEIQRHHPTDGQVNDERLERGQIGSQEMRHVDLEGRKDRDEGTPQTINGACKQYIPPVFVYDQENWISLAKQIEMVCKANFHAKMALKLSKASLNLRKIEPRPHCLMTRKLNTTSSI